MIKGTLIPIGGNEDKGMNNSELYTLDFIGKGILSHVVHESGGTNANIVIIPTASSIPKEVSQNYSKAFSKLGCNNIEILDLRKRKQSEDTDNLRVIEKANCIMFSGGDQSKITEVIGGTKMHELLQRKYEQEEFVIAGTSAGAMSMSEEMIKGGISTEALFKGGVQMGKGMSFMRELIIDTHFIQRGRFGRLAESVARFPKLLGLGLAEDTAVIIKHGTDCKVIGSGMVVLFNPSKLTHNNVEILKEGTPMSMANLIVHILANSDRFSISQRQITILPIEAEFE